MAWIKEGEGGRWLNRKERAELIAEYKDIVAEFRAGIDAGAEYDDDMWIEMQTILDELDRIERIHRCENDQLEFAIEYFSEARNPGNAGNWDGFDLTKKEDAAEFHREICGILDNVSTKEKNAKIALAAPRSHAKSSYNSKAFPLHQVVYRLRKYIIIISETPSVSGPNLEWLATQLKHNEKLRADFGPLLSPRKQENVKDNNEEFIAWEPRPDGSQRQLTKVEAASTGQALRGRNWQGTRPDLIVCDDLEDAKTNAATPEQRKKLLDWIRSVVMPLGDPKGEKTAMVVMGTTVHYDSALMHLLYKRSDFTSKIYRAIISPPTNGDLWERCREIYQDYENKNRQADAKEFYLANKAEMDKGAEVLWPEFQPLWKLMTWRYDNGSKAFNTEYQNNPIDEESMIFNPETFTYWDETEPNKKFKHSEYIISMGFDFAMGKERGDFSAITTTATHRETGVHYVIDSYVERVHPDVFLDAGVEKVIEFEPDVIGVESQMAQEWFADKLREYLNERGFPGFTRVKKIHQRTRKELRIEAMLPDVESGKIRFSQRHMRLLEQFERYGQGGHDDAIDSMEISIRVSRQAKRRLQDKPAFL